MPSSKHSAVTTCKSPGLQQPHSSLRFLGFGLGFRNPPPSFPKTKNTKREAKTGGVRPLQQGCWRFDVTVILAEVNYVVWSDCFCVARFAPAWLGSDASRGLDLQFR